MAKIPGGANKGGRPPFVPTDAQRQIVLVLRANGIELEQIARELGCDRKTMYKHFRVELDTALEQLRARIGLTLVQKALGKGGKTPDTVCMIYWLRTHGGPTWAQPGRGDAAPQEGGGGPQQIVVRFSPDGDS